MYQFKRIPKKIIQLVQKRVEIRSELENVMFVVSGLADSTV